MQCDFNVAIGSGNGNLSSNLLAELEHFKGSSNIDRLPHRVVVAMDDEGGFACRYGC
jgi:hypothetical protein